nr:MAG TPA: hypothetical protein [Caudoviricetes sp.]
MLYNSCTRLAVVSLRGLSAETASLLYNSEVVFLLEKIWKNNLTI